MIGKVTVFGVLIIIHMSKRHGNILTMKGRLPTKPISELSDHSYVLFIASLPKKAREVLQR